ncbi:C-C motif chemokine 19-like [Hippocampus zosterae]|uniref:C-C motif chemokine 19-like n=1 Tax=Hippocampus zosterae TaxID=109293 RepID=UPI00223D70EE|nr:C-C motif chemokine 19-like [Hippocampus zosterae]
MKPQVVVVALLLLLALVCRQPAAGEKLISCCLDTSTKCFPRQIVVGYYHQEAGKGCRHSATVFISKAGKRLCAPALHKSKCVQELVAFLDKRSKSKKQ